MDWHYPALRSPWLSWLPKRCTCGRYRCPSLVRQERARRRHELAEFWDERQW